MKITKTRILIITFLSFISINCYADSSEFVEKSKELISAAGQNITDAAITTKVKSKYVKENLLGDSGIAVTGVRVTTKDRVVYLTGTVHTKDVAKKAVTYAKSIEGVKSVVSKLVVK